MVCHGRLPQPDPRLPRDRVLMARVGHGWVVLGRVI